jgi:hypothetical protein
MRNLACLFLSVAMLAPSSCSRSAPESGGGGAGQGAGAAGDASGGEAAPIALTDARLDKYLAFRKEWNPVYARWLKESGELARTVDSKSTDLSKAFTAVAGSQRLGEKYARELDTLRARHGFTEDEDSRLSAAIEAVVAARVLDNPLLADTVKVYREMQAKGGEEKKAADEILKSMEDQEKQALAEARATYGDACVDVLSKRVKEVGQLQIDLWKEVTGQVPGQK